MPDAYSVPDVQGTQSVMLGRDSLENKISKSMNKVVHMNNMPQKEKRHNGLTEDWVARA